MKDAKSDVCDDADNMITVVLIFTLTHTLLLAHSSSNLPSTKNVLMTS